MTMHMSPCRDPDDAVKHHTNKKFSQLFSLLLWVWLSFAGAQKATAEPGQNSKSVTTATLESLYIYPKKDAPARVVSLNDARVSAETAGVIKAIEVEVGDKMNKGDLIAKIDCEEYEVSVESTAAQVKGAAAKLRFGKSQLETANKLSAKKNIAKEVLDKRRSDFQVAGAEVDRLKAALKNSKRMVDNCRVRAPFSGVIVERIASIGDYAIIGTPIARLLDNKNIEVSAYVQEQDFASLKQASQLVFFNRQEHFNLQLRAILPLMKSKQRSFEVRLSFQDVLAAPGATGRLQWSTDKPHISSEYFVRRGDKLGIFTLNDGRARFHPMTDALQGRPARLSLPGSIQVIIDGRYSLNDGDLVTVTKPDPG